MLSRDKESRVWEEEEEEQWNSRGTERGRSWRILEKDGNENFGGGGVESL